MISLNDGKEHGIPQKGYHAPALLPYVFLEEEIEGRLETVVDLVRVDELDAVVCECPLDILPRNILHAKDPALTICL